MDWRDGFTNGVGEGKRNEPASDRLVRGPAAFRLRWGLILLIVGYLLFSHLGCHGDEDNELFAPVSGAASARR